MKDLKFGAWLTLGAVLTLMGSPAQALPGQLKEEVATWIDANPTLRPRSGEQLMVRKFNTAAQRFTFQASVLPVGRAAPTPTRGMIRTEELEMFDMVHGINFNRLEESLRAVYGLDVYQDYAKAQTIYTYPAEVDPSVVRNRPTALKKAVHGQIRAGDRFGYWMEIAETPNGIAYSGQVTVFLKEDLDKLESELRNIR